MTHEADSPTFRRGGLRRCALVAVLVAATSACASRGGYVWVQEIPPGDVGNDYVISPGDLVAVRVFNQDSMSTHARVRSDGKLAVPFLGDVEVGGRSPAEVRRELERRFKEYVVSPAVTVTVEESQPTSIAVLGEVARPGNYTVDGSSGVLQALAASGGLTDFASRSSIFVVRRGSGQRIRFDFGSLSRGDGRASSFRVRTGDVVIVE